MGIQLEFCKRVVFQAQTQLRCVTLSIYLCYKNIIVLTALGSDYTRKSYAPPIHTCICYLNQTEALFVVETSAINYLSASEIHVTVYTGYIKAIKTQQKLKQKSKKCTQTFK